MKLSKFAEALAEGWHAYRVTLSAEPRDKTRMHFTTHRPTNPARGDVWIIQGTTKTYIYTGFRWREIKYSARFDGI